MIKETRPALGVDVGALYVKLVMADGDGRVGSTKYVAHRGHPVTALRESLAEFLDGVDLKLGITGTHAAAIAAQLGIEAVDMVRAQVAAVKERAPRARNIIDVGGGSVTLIRLNEKGEFEGMTRNSLCAAGTGSFLDEQAARLNLNYDELNDFPSVADPPRIATRCAVFAKSDLIHHQQAGRDRVECWSGLCHGMVRTFLGTLLKGRPLAGLTVIVGGVAQNPEIMRRLKELYGDLVMSLPDSHLIGAMGAAMLARAVVSPGFISKLTEGRGRMEDKALASRPALKLVKSKYPSWEVEESYKDSEESEVRVTRLPGGHRDKSVPATGEERDKSVPATKEERDKSGPATKEERDKSGPATEEERDKSVPPTRAECYMGVDIGSTSTKLLLTDLAGEVLCDVYRKTSGDPIGATKKLFDALLELGERRGVEFEIKGAVTTGSGRKMVGLVIGADDVVNEITCHVTGAMRVDPGIDTIFEIGGQDSKYMRTKHGVIRDAAMNYVCAAGTGSFVEEVSRKMGYAVEDVGAAVMDISPPHTSDRCTVFMEQDVNRLLRAGQTREEALAAVLYSVVQNYLNKVVARRYYSRDKIFFQGATARNPGLVAAFENLLGVEMVVSPYAHVMGAWGAALLARERMEERQGERDHSGTKFRGLDLSKRKITLRAERCEQCANDCELTFAEIEGVEEEPSWGYMCGREPGEKKKRTVGEYRLFEAREKLLRDTGQVELPPDAPTVAAPRALSMYTYLPLWRRFFGELGYRLKVSPTTNPEIKKLGTEVAAGDFCFPVKAALGHGRWALEKSGADWVFIPHTISNKPNEYTTNSYFCPYVQSYPSLVKTAAGLHGVATQRLLAPVLDLRWPEKKQVMELTEKLGPSLGVSQKQVKLAWSAALASQQEFEDACVAEGKRALDEIAAAGKPAVLILGRPYNTCDPGINLELVRKIAERGHTVIPLDFMPFDPAELGPEFSNLFWNYPQRIIHAMKKFRENPLIYPVYFTNFNCGPDSFVETYAEHLSGEKPMLILGLDEHDADAGYITRIEAFLDVLRNAEPVTKFPDIHVPVTSDDEFKRRTIWIPNMHSVGAELGAAAFRGAGYDAQMLPLETDESFEIGRRLTSGNECLPTVVTIGAFVGKLREIGYQPGKHAFFMATAGGPCRFGQYALKHRIILNELGYSDVPILSPSALNSYQGLPEALRRQIWTLFVASDILMKLRCRVAPYELEPGETQRTLDRELTRLARVVENNGNFEREWLSALDRLSRVPRNEGPDKPLVGIVGEIYVRCNAFTNDRVIESVERFGGEAWLAPLSEWFLYTTFLQKWRAKEDLRGIVYRGQSLVKNKYIQSVEHDLYKKAAKYMRGRMEPDIESVVEAGAKYLPLNFEGEAILTAGRAVKFIEDGAGLVVNCAPFGCMPGTITSALFQEVQNRTGVPVVSMFYDGEGDLNSLLGVYLAQVRGPGGGSDGVRESQHGRERAGQGQAEKARV
ncbi:MAG TPA: acyl-CoA dehydratase activase [bacterium]|nr:acyl-CoA dehydratase activase [bacterium]